MVEYKPSFEKISVNGSLVSPRRARRMVNKLESAIETAEKHQDLPDGVKYNNYALSMLNYDEISEDAIFGVVVTVSGDVSNIPTDEFAEVISEREIQDLYEVVGKVRGDKLDAVHSETEELVSFTLDIPSEVEE